MREVAVDALAPLLPRQLLAVADHGRGTVLGLVTVEEQVTELGVRHELAVEEQPRADPRAEREHDDDTVAVATGAVAHLGESGGVGVVDHVHRAARRLGEHGVDVGADPRLVDVRRRAGDAVAHDRREGHADVAVPVEVVDELARRRRPSPPGSPAGA